MVAGMIALAGLAAGLFSALMAALDFVVLRRVRRTARIGPLGVIVLLLHAIEMIVLFAIYYGIYQH